MFYEVYIVGNNGSPISSFESDWRFKERESIFIWERDVKRGFIINHITHDILETQKHVIRLYCQEKKLYY